MSVAIAREEVTTATIRDVAVIGAQRKGQKQNTFSG